MNLDAPEYKFVRDKMIDIMGQVMPLMNRMKKEREKDNPEQNQTLNNRIKAAKVVSVSEVMKNYKRLDSKFHFPAVLNYVKETDKINISYKVATKKYKKVKDRQLVELTVTEQFHRPVQRILRAHCAELVAAGHLLGHRDGPPLIPAARP